MKERVKLWAEDYPHFATDPKSMVDKLKPLIPLIGKAEFETWEMLASEGRIEELFEQVMVKHYDPCYSRSMLRNYGSDYMDDAISLESLEAAPMRHLASELALRFAKKSAEGL